MATYFIAPARKRWSLFPSPLNLGYTSNWLWPVKCSRSEIAQGPSQGLKRLPIFSSGAQEEAPVTGEAGASLLGDERLMWPITPLAKNHQCQVPDSLVKPAQTIQPPANQPADDICV